MTSAAELEVAEVELAAGARAATTEELAVGLGVGMAAEVRRWRSQGGRTARRRCGRGPTLEPTMGPGSWFVEFHAFRGGYL
jgi:hypothetical protein